MAATRSTMDKLFETRMTTMARAYRDLGDAPGAAGMDFDEPLAMIVDAEWDARRVNKRVRLLRQAAFSAPDANVADVRYDPDRELDRERVVDLAGCSWIRDARNVVVTGATESGRTWIGCALGVAARNALFSVRERSPGDGHPGPGRAPGTARNACGGLVSLVAGAPRGHATQPGAGGGRPREARSHMRHHARSRPPRGAPNVPRYREPPSTRSGKVSLSP